MALNIPKRMKERLEQDSGINSFTLTSVNNLKPWLDANTTVFFPEYTDHSFVHLNEVLATAESIITDESWDTITPEDVSAMIVSVLLHDCAMHITEDGFYSLIKDIYPPIKSQYVSTEPKWSLMWSEYIAEAKRFNSDKLKSIFNDTKPVNDIPEDKLYLSTKDKLLIGEFIRRHHARIAHEIVFNGVPGTEGKTLKLAEAQKPHFLDLCGFIAKSHNMSLRQAVDKIPYPKRRIHLNTHVPFLMSVLRISDYIQVQATRAPSQLLNVKSLISPISKGEWKKHDAILEISHADEDPEALFIDAEPQDAIIFEDLRWLFGDIQRELDEVWAVLGEVYGRYDEMSNLGINIRRLRSSLDDVNKYIEDKKPNFIPKVLKFRTADSEMMELLIAPLYGDKPEIGIRELVQNSVDACLERDDIIKKQDLTIEKPDDYDVCVSVIEHEDYGEVVIEDYGVGMTLDIVENYFLNIGASFRNSDRWKKTHETHGSSDVNRTGRFGIGLLAAYLLGDELEVETRHINSSNEQGLKFRCSRGSKSVTISNIDCHVGTKISIKVNSKIISELIEDPDNWDWFCLAIPKVKRLIVYENGGNREQEILDQRIVSPLYNANLEDSEWNRVNFENYSDLFWSHKKYAFDADNDHYKLLPVLICNGIFVNNVTNQYERTENYFSWSKDSVLKPLVPSILVYDQDGIMPLNIQRTELTTNTPDFYKEIGEDITNKLVNSFFELALPRDFSTFKKSFKLVERSQELEWKPVGFSHFSGCFIFSKKGIMLLEKNHMKKSEISSLQIIASENNFLLDENTLKKYFDNFLLIFPSNSSLYDKSNWVRNFFELRETSYYREQSSKHIPLQALVGSRLLINKKYYKDICKPGYLPKTFQKKLVTVWEDNIWILLENSNTKQLPVFEDTVHLAEKLYEEKTYGIIFHYFDWHTESKELEGEDESSVGKAWLELNNGNAYFKV